jgi:hypothetical protein
MFADAASFYKTVTINETRFAIVTAQFLSGGFGRSGATAQKDVALVAWSRKLEAPRKGCVSGPFPGTDAKSGPDTRRILVLLVLSLTDKQRRV